MSWFSRFKDVNVRREEAEKEAFKRLGNTWNAFLKEHAAASKEFIATKAMWDQNQEKGKEIHELNSLQEHEKGLIMHASNYDPSADPALRMQQNLNQTRNQQVGRLYNHVVDENRHLNEIYTSIQESDQLSKTQVAELIQRINAQIPKVADFGLDYATHADNYTQIKSDISKLKELIKRKSVMSTHRKDSITKVEILRKEELSIEQQIESLRKKEEEIAEKIRHFEKKEKNQDNQLKKEQDEINHLGKIGSL